MRNLLLLFSIATALLLLWSASRPILAVQQPVVEQQLSVAGGPVGGSDASTLAMAADHFPEPALALNQMIGPRLRVQSEATGEGFAEQLAVFVARFTAKPSDEHVLELPQGKVIDLRELGQSVLVVRDIDGEWYFDEF